jgi:replicative DNA helicase
MDFEWLKKHCQEAKDKHGCKIVLIDHLHFLVDMNTKQNMSLNIGAFMRKLKQEIAIRLGMGVVRIAHQAQSREGDKASIYAIRDSSFVAQEADSVIIVTRRKNYGQDEKEKLKKKYGEDKFLSVIKPEDEGDIDDPYSAGFAIVTIERTRRTGIFEAKKLFQKVGHFLQEV